MENDPSSPTSPTRASREAPAHIHTPVAHGNLRAALSHTPLLVNATPRTPSQSAATPIGKSPAVASNAVGRGDIGRGIGRAVILPLRFADDDGINRLRPLDSQPNSQDYPGLPGDSPVAERAQFNQVGVRDRAPVEAQLVEAEVWGTSISVKKTAKDFREFIETFELEGSVDGPYYWNQLAIIRRTELMVLNLNCYHLEKSSDTRALYKQLLYSPQDLIPIMDAVINEIYNSIHVEEIGNQPRIQVRPYNLTSTSRMRDLDPGQIETLVAIKGMVVRTSQVIPDLAQAYFRCSVCAHGLEVAIDRGRIDDPSSCPQCQVPGSMTLIHNRSLYSDKQLVRLQETPDEVPDGETPCTISLCVHGDLVDSVRPGDRVEITGIFRALPRRVNPKHRVVKSIYRTYIDAIHFRMMDHSNLEKNSANDCFSVDRIRQFEDFAKDDAYHRLVQAFAPSIWEMDDVKRGVLCLLFGGSTEDAKKMATSRKDQLARLENGIPLNAGEDARGQDSFIDSILAEGTFEEGAKRDDHSKIKQRGDINILLCGDPGTSKSQMLSYVHKITPRGIYTSGKGSSAVGLTASVVKDPDTKEMILESGALVLSDNGICCIDEFDKMNETTRAILHEAMEQQTVSITKAGIVANLNARTSILASANPVESRYNARRSVVENIKLPPTLLSRFDLIYLVLDKPNADSDRRLARHLVSLYHVTTAQSERTDSAQVTVDQSFLRDYIKYARMNFAPDIGEEAVEVLVQGYLNMRSLGGSGSKTISATPRQLESLIRISQALAKMRLCDTVTRADVDEAIRLMKVATQTAATDPRTGTIDMDMITTGRTALDRDQVLKFADELRNLLSSHQQQRLTVGQLRQLLLKSLTAQAQASGAAPVVSMAEVEEAVRELETEGLVQYVDRTQTVIVRGTHSD